MVSVELLMSLKAVEWEDFQAISKNYAHTPRSINTIFTPWSTATSPHWRKTTLLDINTEQTGGKFWKEKTCDLSRIQTKFRRHWQTAITSTKSTLHQKCEQDWTEHDTGIKLICTAATALLIPHLKSIKTIGIQFKLTRIINYWRSISILSTQRW